ncbi:hypothetical protein BHM03_00029739, partial [Ensete ventricosum]
VKDTAGLRRHGPDRQATRPGVSTIADARILSQVTNGRSGSTGDTDSISTMHDFRGPQRTAVIDRQRSASLRGKRVFLGRWYSLLWSKFCAAQPRPKPPRKQIAGRQRFARSLLPLLLPLPLL